ncbi:MAG: rhomboid family intramembrane serine protease [Limnochordaceae bacterium]|nr:rhomboid family intramembrane serine protease [Limnochordaceae bacterium]
MPTPAEQIAQRRARLREYETALNQRAADLRQRRRLLERERRALAQLEKERPVRGPDLNYFVGPSWQRWFRRLDSATHLLIALNVGLFLVDWLLRAVLPASGGLFALGAKFGPAIVLGHQYWRLVTAAFLHGGMLHLLLNTYALAYLGPPLEQVLGVDKFLLVYLAGGITGNAISTLLFPMVVSIGSSSAIFGLLGYFLFVRLAASHLLTPTGARSIAMLIGVNLLFGFLPGTHVDNGAHLGGLLGGLLAGVLVGPPAYGRDLGRQWPMAYRVLAAAALLGVWVLSVLPRTLGWGWQLSSPL